VGVAREILKEPHLPSPADQATNAIRYIGEQVLKFGSKIRQLPPSLYAEIGAASPAMAYDIINQLTELRLVDRLGFKIQGGDIFRMENVGLTLSGWEKFESEKRGNAKGSYGFLAIKFGHARLDKFITDTLKPTIKTGINYDLFDMRDVARAGVIDNLMRAQIRDSSFAIVDLTHDNSGAYWEAGYAEGLGKPVIYICEKSKFNEAQTHFDTNHCTTVLWSSQDIELFKKEIVATLRRSLNLIPS
jgi:hypothetical protein